MCDLVENIEAQLQQNLFRKKASYRVMEKFHLESYVRRNIKPYYLIGSNDSQGATLAPEMVQ